MVRLDQTQNAFVFTTKIRSRENFSIVVSMLFNQSTFVPFRIPCERQLSPPPPPPLADKCVPFHKAKEKECLQTAWKTQILNVGFVEKQSSQITIYAPHVYKPCLLSSPILTYNLVDCRVILY